MRPNNTPGSSARARARGWATRWASVVVPVALLAFTAGCAEETTEKASEPEPTATSTPSPPQSSARSGLWTTEQACEAIAQDDAKELAIVISFMEAQPPDMDHVVAAEAVADDFRELGAGTDGELGDHLTDLANEVHALVAELWEAGDDWVVADEAFDLSYFDDAVVGLAEECHTLPEP